MKKRKNKIIFMVICVSIIAISVVFIKTSGLISKKSSEFIFDDSIETTLFPDVNFYVNAPNGNGKTNRINIEFKGDGSKYVGIAYLPGDTIIEECYLFFDSESEISIKKHLIQYKSGDFKLAGDGYSAIFILEKDGKKYDFMLTTMMGSQNVLPLFINIDESLGTIEEMNSDSKHDTECYGKASFGDTEEYISIKGRGNSTWSEPKKPYNITFYEDLYDKKKNVSMVEDIKTKKWTLLANYLDPTLMRNKIGYDLANQMGIGLPSKYYDVWMNGNYLGNYLVTPKYDYQAPENGYSLELDNFVDEESEQFKLNNNGVEDDNLLFTIKTNDGEIDYKDIKTWMQKLWDSIEDFDSERYQDYIDIDSFAKMYLIYEIDKNNDVIAGSILMYRNSNSSKDKLIAGPIWDLDGSFGKINWSTNFGNKDNMFMSAHDWCYNSLSLTDGKCFLQELGKHDSFKKKVIDIYYDYSLEIESLNDSTRMIQEILGPSALMDFSKWYNLIGDKLKYKLSERMIFDGNVYYEGQDIDINTLKYPLVYIPTNDYYDYTVNLQNYIKARLIYIKENIDNI